MTDGATTSDLTTLAKGGSINLVGSALGAALSMALIVVLTRGLGADTAGAFFEAMALFNIVVIAVTVGADTGLLRYTAMALAKGRRPAMSRLLIVGLGPVVVVGAFVGVAVFALAGPLSRWLGDASHADTVATFVRTLALFIPAGGAALAILGATRGFGTMLPTVVAERIARPLGQIALVVAAVVAGSDLGYVARAWGAGIVISLGIGAAWLRNLHDSAPPTEAADVDARAFWAFTAPRALASVFRVGVQWLDIILVGGLISPRAAAVYTVATRLLQAGFLAVDAVGQAVEPMFSRLLERGDNARARALYQGATGWLVAGTWPYFLAVWAFAPTVLGLFGNEFTGASSVVAILAASALVGSGFGPVDVLLVMTGKSLLSFWNSAISLTLNVVLNLALIPSMGLEGAALAWAVSRVAANLLPLLQVRALYGFHPFGRSWVLAAIAAALVFGAGGVAVRIGFGSSPTVLATFLVTAIAIYGAAMWRWRDDLELPALLGILRRSAA